MTPTLLLWDIDGTLINSGGAGMQALVRATRATLDVEIDLRQIDWAGRTDRHIGRMILEHLERPVTDDAIHKLIETYLAFLPEEMPLRKGTVLPGVITLLEHFESRQTGTCTQGLLTGNMARGAEIKLGYYGLWRYFSFGAFADDSSDRNALGPHALRKAAAHCGTAFSPEHTWVIGDTPHDIACGKAFGARTLAVATGKYTEDALREHEPTALFGSFVDTDAFLDLIERGG